jgi:FixH
MNWGYKLLVVFIAFGSLMSYMVYRCVNSPVDLVDNEYYKDELVYQDVIDGAKNANALSSRVKLLQDSAFITIQFPEEMKNTNVNGTVLFYCPADGGRDKKLPLDVSPSGLQRIRAKAILPGNYTVKIQWESRRNHYYSEEPFIIL